jgi:RimJ/RimL family protein N-acetyltransferase
MNPENEIRTNRLLLRQWKISDRDCFAKLNSDSEVMKYFPSALDRAESDSIAQVFELLISERGWGFWAAELLESGNFIGFVGLNKPIDKLPFTPCVEVGWRLAKEYWGHGFATEAALASLKFGFVELDLDEIVSFTSVVNTRSRKVMERIGMMFNNELFSHPCVPEGSELKEHCLYRISKEHWASSAT